MKLSDIMNEPSFRSATFNQLPDGTFKGIVFYTGNNKWAKRKTKKYKTIEFDEYSRKVDYFNDNKKVTGHCFYKDLVSQDRFSWRYVNIYYNQPLDK